MAMLARAFGIDKLPNVPNETEAGKISDYLSAIENLIYGSSRETTASVYNGWVRNNGVIGMSVPEGEYYITMTDITTKKNGVVSYGENGNSKFVYVEFTVLAGGNGENTPYKGCKIRDSLQYPFENVEGKVIFKKDDSGKWTNQSLLFSKVIRLTIPEVEELVPVDDLNICPHWLNSARVSQQVLKGKTYKNKNGKISLSWGSLEPIYTFEKKSTSSNVEIPNETLSNDEKARKLFIQGMDILVGSKSVDSSGTPTTEAKAVLGPVIQELREKGVVTSKNLKEFTTEEIRAILNKFDNNDLKDIKRQLSKLDFENEEVLINTNTEPMEVKPFENVF